MTMYSKLLDTNPWTKRLTEALYTNLQSVSSEDFIWVPAKAGNTDYQHNQSFMFGLWPKHGIQLLHHFFSYARGWGPRLAVCLRQLDLRISKMSLSSMENLETYRNPTGLLINSSKMLLPNRLNSGKGIGIDRRSRDENLRSRM